MGNKNFLWLILFFVLSCSNGNNIEKLEKPAKPGIEVTVSYLTDSQKIIYQIRNIDSVFFMSEEFLGILIINDSLILEPHPTFPNMELFTFFSAPKMLKIFKDTIVNGYVDCSIILDSATKYNYFIRVYSEDFDKHSKPDFSELDFINFERKFSYLLSAEYKD